MRWPAAAILYTIWENANAFSPMMKKVALIWRSLSVFRTRSVCFGCGPSSNVKKTDLFAHVWWCGFKAGLVSNAFGLSLPLHCPVHVVSEREQEELRGVA